MPSLADTQRAFISTVNEGPDALDAALFAGTPERIILGLKAHANTISHARLVALEKSFPLTRSEIGEDRFNGMSRAYVETALAKGCDLAHIGRYFAAFLQNEKQPEAVVDLAAVEWAWLESYHAADASPLTLEAISAMAETDLLNLTVILHPSPESVRCMHRWRNLSRIWQRKWSLLQSLSSVPMPKCGYSPSTTQHSKPHKNVGSPPPSVTFSHLPANKGVEPTPSGRS
jgi:hypothetical protein